MKTLDKYKPFSEGLNPIYWICNTWFTIRYGEIFHLSKVLSTGFPLTENSIELWEDGKVTFIFIQSIKKR